MQRGALKRLEDYDLPLGERSPRGPYFARVCDWSEAVCQGLRQVHALARRRGVIVEGRLPNPDEGQIAALTAALGPGFEPTAAFAAEALNRWLPQAGRARCEAFAEVLVEEYAALRAQGKPEGVLKNLYTKLMCWLSFRFGRLLPLLEEARPPIVLMVSDGLTAHELALLRGLWAMGADVLLVEPRGDGAYARLDPDSRWAQRLEVPNAEPFPGDFSLRGLGEARPAAEPPRPEKPATPAASAPTERRFQPPRRALCVNDWMAEPDYRQLLTPPNERGSDPGLCYTGFVRVRGAQDRGEYVGELYRFYQALLAGGRRVAVVDGPMPAPQPEEIAKIRRRGRYDSAEAMIADLAGNLPVEARDELLRHMGSAFVQVMGEAAQAQPNLHRLTATAVYLLCRAHRYGPKLFHGWREGDVPVFILMGGCRDADEALFVRWLSLLPTDVLVLCPDLSKPCALADGRLLELRGEESLAVARFPRDDAALRMSTLAAHAEGDLDELLYSDSGLYRSRQFERASAITLRTTYDELFILWNQDLKYRQGFAIANGTVTMPVLFAKISGVEGGKLEPYWRRVKALTEGDVFYVSQLPINQAGGNPYQGLALSALRGGKLNRALLMADARYPFALLRQEVQEHILDKLQLMLDRRLIRGTFVNGTEYAVVSTVLNMDKALIRALQAFDFTRRNPKVVCVSTREAGATLEDAILLTFLNLAGFDIALFVPTGYQSVERFMAENPPVEHQAGEYMYDLIVPDLSALPEEKGPSWLERLFRRER